MLNSDPDQRQPAFIFDIDGTIARNTGRSPYDWSRVREDEPIWPILNLVKLLRHHGLRAIGVSGRMEQCRYDTEDWIDAHIHINHILHMRADGDFRPDTHVKEEMYHTKIEPYFQVLYVLDDRAPVVDMWRRLGLTCLQVAAGPEEKP